MSNKKFTLIFVLLIWYNEAFSQIPQAISYQAVARNTNGTPVASKPIKIKISILQASSTGQVIYQETHDVVTDNSGVFSIKIGLGTAVVGVFGKINWASGNKFVKSEYDFNDSNGFLLSGTSQMLSVPYALYSGRTAFETQWKTNSDSSIYYKSGKVGMGTSSPTSLLSMEINSVESSPDRTMLWLNNKSIDDGSLSQIKMSSGISGSQTMINHASTTYQRVPNTNDYGSIATTGAGFLLHAGGTGNLRFMTSGDGTQGFERMSIANDGNVGIGDFVTNGSIPPKSKLQVRSGDVYLETIGTGVIMKSPNGQCWRITIDNTGNLTRTAIACP